MTPQVDPLEELKTLKKRQAPARPSPPAADPLDELKAMGDLRSIKPPHDPGGDISLGDDLKALRAQQDTTSVARHPTPAPTPEGAPLAQRVAETVVSGFPGAQRAVAGYRGLISLLAGEGLQGAAQEVDGALSEQRQHVAAMPTAARLPLQIAGGAPAAAALAPLGVTGGGAVFGAAMGADRPATSLKDRAINTGLGAVEGAVAAKGTQLAGRGLANLSTRTGLTDAIAKVVDKVNPKVAATMGTRGQVNQALSDRQDILDALGDGGQTAAKAQLSRIAARKAQARVLYDAARKDTRVLADPELQTLLSDPQIQKAYQTASDIRAASGNPLPRQAAPAHIPSSLQGMGVNPENYARLTSPAMLKARGVANTGTDILASELSGAPVKGVEMPDPDVLARVKRYLYDAAQGRQDSPLAMHQDEARALLPKVDAIRAKLHELSPAWQTADRYYAGAKGEEEAFAHGFDAFRLSKNPSGDQLATHSPEAMLAEIETPRYPGEPASAMQARANAFRQGVRAAAAAQVRGAPIDKGLSSILRTSALAPTEATQQTRSLMFGNPGDAQALEQLLGTSRGSVMAAEGSSTPSLPTSTRGLLRSLARHSTGTPDRLATPTGQAMLADRLGNAGLLTREVSAAKQGGVTNDFLARLIAISAAGQGAR